MGVYGRTERGLRGLLCVLVGINLTLLGVGLITLEAYVGDVVIHGKATGAGVVPFEIDASV